MRRLHRPLSTPLLAAGLATLLSCSGGSSEGENAAEEGAPDASAYEASLAEGVVDDPSEVVLRLRETGASGEIPTEFTVGLRRVGRQGVEGQRRRGEVEDRGAGRVLDGVAGGVDHGDADDLGRGDGATVLTYAQAVEAANGWDPYSTLRDGQHECRTVGDVCRAYLLWAEDHRGRSASEARYALNAHRDVCPDPNHDHHAGEELNP